MRTVHGKSDGRTVWLGQPVAVAGETDVLVTFPDLPASGELRDLLLRGPTLSEEELAPLHQFMEGFRRWKV